MEIRAFLKELDRHCDSSPLENFVGEFNGSALGGNAATQGCQCTTSYGVDGSGNQVCVEVCGYSNFNEIITADVSGSPVIPIIPDIPPVPHEPDPVPPVWTFGEVLGDSLTRIASSEELYGVKREIKEQRHGWWMPKSGGKADGRLILRSFTATITIFEKIVG